MSTLVCPSCAGEFRAGFIVCQGCDAALIPKELYLDQKRHLDDPRLALAGRATTHVVEAGLSTCREIEAALLAAGIPAYVDAASEDGEPLSPGAMKVGVVVAEEDLPRVAGLMRARFEGLLRSEGVGMGIFHADPIDLSLAEITCPACGHVGALSEGTCADCGLFLGAPE